ncbi:MAG: PAS domain S-box protein [Desulfarculaceae bacterium]|nr:PAS domain S-box protein [Desulfarculaceae bacterium]MCF8071151.1 PAS domain S-box protein [Desulfarculaceae bacterium]MCF8101246.1 PAS domain S-box protein [Desulfarculaceae bacterium]MCF8115205.1 PAS domain S-box protein [Desulfarculaceae bacterium]
MSVYWGIRKKLLVITALTMLPLLAGSVWVTIRLVERSYTSQTRLMEEATLSRVASRLDFLIQMAKSDAAFLAELPDLGSLARSVNSGGVDPVTGEAYSWAYRDSLSGLISFMDAKQVYDQARLLDAKGQEVLRVNLVDGRAEEVPRSGLQDKSKRYYFTEAARLPMGKVFVSDVDLNRERGEIEKPYKPMLRFVSPLRNAQGRLLGVVVLNFYANRMFQDALGGMPERTGGTWMIMSQDGYYLYHNTRPEMLWGAPRDLDTGKNCQQEFGRTCRDFLAGQDTQMDRESGQVTAYAAAVDLQRGRDKWLAIIHLAPPVGIGVYISQFGWVLTAVTIAAMLIAILLAWSSGRIVVNPLLELAATMKRFSQEDWSARSQVHSRDEMGTLSDGFNEMAGRLQSLYNELESKVAARTEELEQSNQSLVQNEARTRAILDNTVDAIITINTKGVVQSFNKGAEKIFGYTAEEVVGQKVNMLQPPDVASHHDEYLKRYLETSEPHIIGQRREEHGRRKDGSLFPMSLAVSEVKVGETRLFTGIIRDITALRAAEDSLRQSQQLYKSLAEAAPVGIFHTDPTGMCTYVNEQWLRMAGISADQAMGDGWAQAIHPEDREAIWQDWERTAKTGNPFEGEYRFQHPDGEMVWFYGRAVPQKDSDGTIKGFVGIVMDITQRKEIERERAESMLLFQSTFEQAAVGIAHVAPDGTWLRVNSRLCSILGYSREEILGDAFQSITHPDDLEADLSLVQELLDGETDSYSLEKRYIKKDQSIVWINLTVSLVRDQNGEPDFFISVVEDIDRRKRAEEDNLRLGQVLEESLTKFSSSMPRRSSSCRSTRGRAATWATTWTS